MGAGDRLPHQRSKGFVFVSAGLIEIVLGFARHCP